MKAKVIGQPVQRLEDLRGLLRTGGETVVVFYVREPRGWPTSVVQQRLKEGVPIAAVTPQNEPLFTPSHYPGMSMSAKQQELYAAARAPIAPRGAAPISGKA